MTIEDDDIQLAPDTLNALAEFMREKDERVRRFEELKRKVEEDHVDRIASMADFEEDWNQSQFWYDDATTNTLAEAILEGATDDTVIGLVSAPTVYVKIREWKTIGRISKNIVVKLFEYDQRFAVFKDDFILYDFQHPLRGLPDDLKGKFDRVLIDPPFLSTDCQTKMALTVRWMTKPWTSQASGSVRSDGADKPPRPKSDIRTPRVMLSTGERMKDLVLRLYRPIGVRVTALDVRHSNNLENEFLCYSSFETLKIQFLKD